ncbi:MAG TPA: helix-turn-helix transcriptional regulator [Stellaceae bacterium]|nr:helix-turn-helix transcriptional regulator [Stellaceae bacterium]
MTVRDSRAVPHPIDLHVGARIRLRRALLGLSQEKVAAAMGITFQQVQKYERGTNRITARRLYEMALVLDVPVSYFFDDLARDPTDGDQAVAARRDDVTLAKALVMLKDKELRRTVRDLLLAVSGAVGSRN